MIKIDIKVGDTILTGKWKNKKVVVKSIGTDEYGNPTVNGKSIMKIRIPKLYVKEQKMKLKEGKHVDEALFNKFCDMLKKTGLKAIVLWVPNKSRGNEQILVSLGWDYSDDMADTVENIANKLGIDNIGIDASNAGIDWEDKVKINGGVRESKQMPTLKSLLKESNEMWKPQTFDIWSDTKNKWIRVNQKDFKPLSKEIGKLNSEKNKSYDRTKKDYTMPESEYSKKQLLLFQKYGYLK